MTEAAPTDAGTGVKAGRIVGISSLCVGMGAALGFAPGFVATELGNDLDISRGQVGLVVSLYFGCTGIGSVGGGRMTEKLGARAVVVLDMVLVALAAMLTVIAGTYWSLIVAAVVAGAAYSLVNAGTNVAIGRAVDPTRRTTAMSIKTAGVPLMAVVGAALGPWAADRWGWQWIMLVIAIVAVGSAIAAAAVLADDRPDNAKVEESKDLPPGFIWFPIGGFLLIAGSQPLYSWTVAYLEQSLDASPVVAGGISALASACGVAFMIFIARRSDEVGPAQRIPRMMILIAVAVAGTLLVLAGEVLGVWVVVIGTIIGISAQLASIGTMHAVVVDRAPHAVARATGVTMTGYYVGALASPALFGAVADATDTFAWSWLGIAVLLFLAIPAWGRANRVPLPSEHQAAAA